MSYIITSKTKNTPSYLAGNSRGRSHLYYSKVENTEERLALIEERKIKEEKERNDRERTFRAGGFFGDEQGYVEAEVHND